MTLRSVAAIADLPDTIAGHLKATLMRAEPEKDRATDAAVQALAEAAFGTLRRSTCHATDSTVKEVFTLYSSSDKRHWYAENPTEPIGVLMNSIMGDALQ